MFNHRFIKSLYWYLLPLVFSTALQATEYDFTAAKSILNGYVNEGKLAGAVVLVLKDDKTVLHYATGQQDVEAGIPMQTNSMFRIASQTKAITSVAIMILQEQGKLKVTDPVSKFIPSFSTTTVLELDENKNAKVVEAKREITIHDLLTHSSGIGYGWGPNEQEWKDANMFGWYFADKTQSVGEALVGITDIPHLAHPGESFVYGHSTDLLGAIVEKVSAQTLDVFFKQFIFDPLHMQDTHFYVPDSKLSRLATVYSATDKRIVRAPDTNQTTNFMVSQGHYAKGPKKAFSGGAGLVSTAQDYAQFLRMLLNMGILDGQRIISAESVSAMTRDQIPYIEMDWNDGFGYAFALTKQPNSDTVVQYEWGGAYHSQYYVRPEDKVAVVYLTQLNPNKGLKDWQHIDAAIKISLGIDR
ncbi:serine hydrolase domain-containing protein [Aliiglaciecola lipolytica]|uniref:Beta-lactamase-related domain-containing protein n=1 Tax=Aliiglaciecola lipolytica E3 TaxID=1127673 RepID=K6Y818_9ALTE|nr:serine hydrolase domain-containing protein [Aliiglaciecola lipolytica]GAC14342.1 hypothetical protein GLIP_1709 [Aliiglaciecola lipolytica E3]